MSDLYRLEACSACRVVRLVMPPLSAVHRARTGVDRPVYVGDVPVWQIDFCPTCKQEYEASLTAERDEANRKHSAAEAHVREVYLELRDAEADAARLREALKELGYANVERALAPPPRPRRRRHANDPE